MPQVMEESEAWLRMDRSLRILLFGAIQRLMYHMTVVLHYYDYLICTVMVSDITKESRSVST